ncbi:hypothetical protein DCAR_0519638 [Daucus carota subsp. sativus]|uniref:SWIM-type domain-containing protein n=2 Tax=Daucus carota subsp. sativus TaxID=79200 RepID=A0AAF0X4T8_DAUCS|nr:hypothetical protein DCAR_0519638 [Daucus carota subsp. sativus]
MPLLDMLQEIHFKLLSRVRQKRDEMISNNLQLCPKIKKLLDERITQSRKWRASWDGQSRYQVKYNTRYVTVDLDKRSCDCRNFDLTGIPCPHALAAIFDRRHQPIDYVSDYYKRDKYLATYSFPLQALKGIDYWDYHSDEELLPPEIPKKLRGRPKRLRRREEWEGGTQGKRDNKDERVQRWSGKRVQKCSKCGKTGHRRPKCPDLQGEQGHGGNQGVQVEQTHVENAPSVKRKKLSVGRPKLPVRRHKTNTVYIEPNVISTRGSQVVQQSPTPPLMTESSETGHFMMQVLGSVGYSAVYTSTPATSGVPHATSTEEAFNLDD